MNGDVSYTETLVGRGETAFRAEATYTCNNGYALQGRFSRECLYNAMWNGSAPVCGEVSYINVENRTVATGLDISMTKCYLSHMQSVYARTPLLTLLMALSPLVRVAKHTSLRAP